MEKQEFIQFLMTQDSFKNTKGLIDKGLLTEPLLNKIVDQFLSVISRVDNDKLKEVFDYQAMVMNKRDSHFAANISSIMADKIFIDEDKLMSRVTINSVEKPILKPIIFESRMPNIEGSSITQTDINKTALSISDNNTVIAFYRVTTETTDFSKDKELILIELIICGLEE